MVMKSLDISFLHKLVKICREQPLFQLIKKRFGVLIHAVDLYLGTSATKPQKKALNLWYVDTRPIHQNCPEHLKVCHIWLLKKKKYV